MDYFISIRYGPHRKYLLPRERRYRYRDPQIENDVSNNTSFIEYIHRRGNVFTEPLLSTKWRDTLTEPLPCNDIRDTHSDTKTDGKDLLNTPLRRVQMS